jgi:hypothetical protein
MIECYRAEGSNHEMQYSAVATADEEQRRCVSKTVKKSMRGTETVEVQRKESMCE